MSGTCRTPGCEQTPRDCDDFCAACLARTAEEAAARAQHHATMTDEIDNVLTRWLRDKRWRRVVADAIAEQAIADEEDTGDAHLLQTLETALDKDSGFPMHHKLARMSRKGQG